MDIGTISGILSGITSATQIANFIKDSSTSLEQAEIQLKLAELIGALAKAKAEMADVQQILTEKDQEIKTLNNKLEISNNIVWQEPYYFIEKDGNREGPFCQNCYDSDGKLIRLQQVLGAQGCWTCSRCDKGVKDASFSPVAFTPNRPNRKTSIRGRW